MNEFDNQPYPDYRSFIKHLALQKKSYKHQIKLLETRIDTKQPKGLNTEADRMRMVELRQKIKEIDADYKDLDHRNF